LKNLCDSCKTECDKALKIPDEEGEKEIQVIVEECSNYKK